jgi:hypothetical protein
MYKIVSIVRYSLLPPAAAAPAAAPAPAPAERSAIFFWSRGLRQCCSLRQPCMQSAQPPLLEKEAEEKQERLSKKHQRLSLPDENVQTPLRKAAAAAAAVLRGRAPSGRKQLAHRPRVELGRASP